MDRINKLALRILAEQVLEADGKDIKSFDMTEEEWERYHDKHPGAKKWNHHIIHTPEKGNMSDEEWEQAKIKAKRDYFKDMKKAHPNYVPIVKKDWLRKLLQNGEYSCISAGLNGNDPVEKEMDMKDEKTQQFIQKRTEALRKDLDRLGVKYTEITGRYGEEEPSFLISHTLRAKANEKKANNGYLVTGNVYKNTKDIVQKLNELGAKYNQDSVSHVKNGDMEWHYTTGEKKGKRALGKGTQKIEYTDNFYSEARIGDEDYTMWSCNVDDENLVDNPYFHN